MTTTTISGETPCECEGDTQKNDIIEKFIKKFNIYPKDRETMNLQKMFKEGSEEDEKFLDENLIEIFDKVMQRRREKMLKKPKKPLTTDEKERNLLIRFGGGTPESRDLIRAREDKTWGKKPEWLEDDEDI